MKKSRVLGVLVLLAGLLYLGLQGMNVMSKPAAELGVTDGRLAACPDKPNCVSSQAPEGQHAIDALRFTGDDSNAWTALRSVIDAYPRASVVEEQEGYLRCEFRTAIMRYVDDVEFLLNAEDGTIEFRSASRIGYSDMGANRKRMEKIRAMFTQAMDGA